MGLKQLVLYPFYGVSREVLLLVGAGFLAGLPYGFSGLVLPIYLSRLGVDTGTIGLLYTLSSLVYTGLLIPSGLLADRFGRRLFVLLGTGLYALAFGLLAVGRELPVIAAATVLTGVYFGTTSAAWTALIAGRVHPANHSRAFALNSVAWTGASALGTFMGGLPEWLSGLLGVGILETYRLLFIGAAVVVAVAWLMVWAVGEDRPVVTRLSLQALIPRRSRRFMVRYTLVSVWTGAAYGLAIQLMPLWFYFKFGVDEGQLSGWFGLSSLMALPTIYVVPWLTGRVPLPRIPVTVWTVAALLLVVMPVLPDYRLAAVAYLLRSLIIFINMPVMQTFLMSRVTPEERGAAAALSEAVWALGSTLTPALAGRLLAAGLYQAPMWAAAGCTLMAAALFHVLLGPEGSRSTPVGFTVRRRSTDRPST